MLSRYIHAYVSEPMLQDAKKIYFKWLDDVGSRIGRSVRMRKSSGVLFTKKSLISLLSGGQLELYEEESEEENTVIGKKRKSIKKVTVKGRKNSNKETIVQPIKTKKSGKTVGRKPKMTVDVSSSPVIISVSSSPISSPLAALMDEAINVGVEMKVDTSAPTPLSRIWRTPGTHGPLLWDDTTFEDVVDIETAQSSSRTSDRRRSSSKLNSLRQQLNDGTLHPHTMVSCDAYETNLQPYKILVHPEASFVCDVHAHLADCEIIGFLGGRWDPETNTVHIQAAFPCRSLATSGYDGSTDVEMDPGSELELRELILQQNMQVVGWYHSHPQFQPDPSIRDIENQCTYQFLFKDHSSDTEPFLGLIVGTYDANNETPVSVFRYFHVAAEEGDANRKAIPAPVQLTAQSRKYREYSDATATATQKHGDLSYYPCVWKQLGFLSKKDNEEDSLCGDEMKEEILEKVRIKSKEPLVVTLLRTESLEHQLEMLKKSVPIQLYYSLTNHYGIHGQRLAEQCLALIDYYATFTGRIELFEKWNDMPKVVKIHTSLTAWTKMLDLGTKQPEKFVDVRNFEFFLNFFEY